MRADHRLDRPEPPRYFHSALLALSLLTTVGFAATSMEHEAGSCFLLACFMRSIHMLFMVSMLLIFNGLQTKWQYGGRVAPVSGNDHIHHSRSLARDED